ncbi:transcription antitermination factor NusB [Candidatus Peregrinibacteria bacterium]|nr:transcription antitermination factor NusB [Candidatus Peregrinibacteria bacterium]MBI3816110.1 transcription antitermination factor NusB [Candidatus Peregrinibacteria bacterium]
MARRRHQSRIAVLQVLFEREKHPSCAPEAALARDAGELGEFDQPFAESLLEGVLLNEDDVRASVQKHAPQWPLDRMDPISRCILLIGAYELLFGNDAPQAVVMNEAIEIAKEYGTEESGKFVNGVLNAIAHGARTN